MVFTRSGADAANRVATQAASEAIARAGNRGLKKLLGRPAARPRPSRPRRAAEPACGAELRRIQQLERIVQALKQGRAATIRRATRPRPDDFRTANMFAKNEYGVQWDQYGPAWASLKFAREIALPNKGPRKPALFRPPPLPSRQPWPRR